MMHYFAYGNLLDVDLMRKLCPSARAVGVMRLDDYEIGFWKCADAGQAGCTLDSAPGRFLWGVQYELSQEDMDKLDKAAGVPEGHWEQQRITVHTPEGKAVETTTYVIPHPSGPHAPPESYVAPIYRGAEALALPGEYVARLRELIQSAQRGAPA